MMTSGKVCSDATRAVILRDCARIGQVYNIGSAGAMFVRNAFTVVTNAIGGREREHLVHRWLVSLGTENVEVTVVVNPLARQRERHALV